MKNLVLSLCAFFAAAACTTQSPLPGEVPPEPLRVAAWNMEHLTAAEGEGCRPRSAADLDLVAQQIRSVDADVWLLQEVDGEAALARVFGEGWTFHVEAREPAGSYPPCWGRDDGSRLRAQNTAIAVRSGLAHQRLPDLADLDIEGDRRTRYGVTVRLEAGAPLDVMSVHLASGCFVGSSAERCPALFDQAEILETWIDTASASGRAVIVGGDFNRRLEAVGDTVWAGLNDGAPAALHVAGAGTGPQCDPQYREFIDFLLLNDAASKRALPGSFRETTSGTSERASDHCPISLELTP